MIPGGSGHGLGSGSSFHGSGSGGSGHGSGSRGGASGGSGGSDGDCSDGYSNEGTNSTSNSGNDDGKVQSNRRTKVTPPPGLAPVPTQSSLPMKIDVGSNLTAKQPHGENSLAQAVTNPYAEEAATMMKGDPVAGLLSEVLLNVSNTLPPQEAVAVCSAVAASLATVLLRNSSAAAAPMPQAEKGLDEQVADLLQREIERQQLQRRSQELQKLEMNRSFQLASAAQMEHGYKVATNAAQLAAAAFQQQQQQQQQQVPQRQQQPSAAWQQQHQARQEAMLLQRVVEQSLAAQAHAPSFHMSCDMYDSSPVPMQLPPHLQSHLQSYMDVQPPMPTPYPSSFAPAATAGTVHKVAKGEGKGRGAKAEGKGATQGKGAKGEAKGAKGEGKGTKQKGGKGAAQAAGDGPAAKGAKKTASADALQTGFHSSLRSNILVLQDVDCDRIVLTRRINRLGFQSAQVLEAYFAKYGKVEQVLVSHCHAKSRNLRFRPAGLGFVVMSTVEEAKAILADGPEVEIPKDVAGSKENVAICVNVFKAQTELEGLDENED